jgi:hypothetical protein
LPAYQPAEIEHTVTRSDDDAYYSDRDDEQCKREYPTQGELGDHLEADAPEYVCGK